MSAEVFGLTQQILMLISAYINTGVCGKLRLWETTHFFLAKLQQIYFLDKNPIFVLFSWRKILFLSYFWGCNVLFPYFFDLSYYLTPGDMYCK